MTSRRTTQRDAILRHLQAGHLIDVPTAQEKFRCFRLSARIRELREAGFVILSIRDTTNPSAFVRYALLSGDDHDE